MSLTNLALVRALHKLYSIQKLAMQEIKTMLFHPSKLFSFNSNDPQIPQAHPKEPHAFPVPDFSNPQSLFWMGPKEVDPSSISRRDTRWGIDLERPPEEYMDELDYQVENKPDLSDRDGVIPGGLANNFSRSFMGINQFASQAGAQAQAQSSSPRPGSERRDGSSSFANVSTPSLESNGEQPLWFLQASPLLTSQRQTCAQTADIAKIEGLQNQGNPPNSQTTQSSSVTYLSSSAQVTNGQFYQYPALESMNNVASPLQDPFKIVSPQMGLAPFNLQSHQSPPATLQETRGPNNPSSENFPLSDMILLSRKPTNNNEVMRTGEDEKNENPNCSGQGSSSPVSESVKVWRNGDVKNARDGIDCEHIHAGHCLTKGGLSTHEDTPHFSGEASISSSIPGSMTDQRNKAKEKKMVRDSLITKIESKREMGIGGNGEDSDEESTLEEGSESMAAMILLSLAPENSQANGGWLDSLKQKMEGESSHSSRDSTSQQKKQIRSTRRASNRVDEEVTWTKPIRRRRRRTCRVSNRIPPSRRR
ncbi:hypothetical protein AMTR_s00065p00174200 [Amborella trichopoda]|uniref:Uncharacterized protein n=1 Tax=Amborella trichopoda TaxID=13333 RepID=U5D8V6_AMBTC|nr:hypothetical protein AMTR_s00065p00174200 [Amborella trichopoda]